jgi:hypothetical protein
VILLADGDEQRALHSVGYPNRSEASGPRKRSGKYSLRQRE